MHLPAPGAGHAAKVVGRGDAADPEPGLPLSREKEAVGTCTVDGKPIWKTDDFGRFLVDHVYCERHISPGKLPEPTHHDYQAERVITLDEAKAMVRRDLKERLKRDLLGPSARLLGRLEVLSVLADVLGSPAGADSV